VTAGFGRTCCNSPPPPPLCLAHVQSVSCMGLTVVNLRGSYGFHSSYGCESGVWTGGGGGCNAPSQRGIKKFQPSQSTHPLWPTMSAEWALRWPIHRAACNADAGPLMELLSTSGVEAGSGEPRAGAALPHIDALDEEGRWVFEFRPEPPDLEAAAAAHDRPPVSAHALLAVHTRYFCAQSENSLGLRVQVVR
jgi:hypothetical protein